MRTLYVIPAILLICALSLTSCYKVEPTIGSIYVVNPSGISVPGAEVHLYFYGHSEPKFDTTHVTNGVGNCSFDLSDCYESGQTGLATLNVTITKGDAITEGVIKIEEQKTNEKTFTLE